MSEKLTLFGVDGAGSSNYGRRTKRSKMKRVQRFYLFNVLSSERRKEEMTMPVII